MEINADFSKSVLVHGADEPWQPSPMVGVERRMLDRIGDEIARATSLVRYAPGSAFTSHIHGGGEEFFVLNGIFQDEHGDYPAGTYVRNPPTSQHTPRSTTGCTLFVKLWQFDNNDRTQIKINTNQMLSRPIIDRPGVTTKHLFEDNFETVQLEFWESGSELNAIISEKIELLVLTGSLKVAGITLHALSWLRLPPKSTLNAIAGIEGATVWVKRGSITKFTIN
jgi:ChrR Cupin-like domain